MPGSAPATRCRPAARAIISLAPGAAPSLLIAGGIGITPIWAMIQRRQPSNATGGCSMPCARPRRLPDILLQRYPDRLSLHVDEEAGGVADLAGFLRTAPADAQLAAGRRRCWTRSNPRRRTGSRPRSISNASGQRRCAAGGFTVIAAASGGSHFVAEGSTILDTLLDAGLDIPHSCADGICGTCATRVIEGIPDHRDTLLSAAEREANKKMLICVSGCKGSRLVLDL